MGVTKSNLFSKEQNDLAIAAKAFAHPARVAIIQYLLNANTCINGDLVHELGLAQATISQHLRELKAIGIVQGTIEGTKVNYCIDGTRWKEIQAQFSHIFQQFGKEDEQTCC